MIEIHKRLDFQRYFAREPVNLALLTGLTVVLFLFVAGLSRMYHAEQESLADEWSARGEADLHAQRYRDAVNDFRTALLYARDNDSYQLNLAEALIGDKRIDEAYAYLINLWDRQPENGLVNLELARIAAGKGQTQKSLRYYHNAVYATWPDHEDTEQRKTRLELIEYLLRINARAQAESELIAQAANPGDKPSDLTHLGDLFLQAQDYERALSEYRSSLAAYRHDPAAIAGAGNAAFELGRYALAQRYLEQAVEAAPDDTKSAARLRITQQVMRLDPFRRQMTTAERARIVVEAFTLAGQRLQSCAPANSLQPATKLTGLAQQWATLKPRITERGLKRNPDLINTAMELVFTIERQTSTVCSVTSDTDTALLLIANMHEVL